MSPVIAFPASARQRRPRIKLIHNYPGALSWIKQRTRALQKHFDAITRADAIALACWDWDMCFGRVKYRQSLIQQQEAA